MEILARRNLRSSYLHLFQSFFYTFTMASEYILHYWPVIPGRGEFIRLALESVKCPYTEKNKPWEIVMKVDKEINSPHFAPPLLEVIEEKAFISQTPAILAYLAPDLGLDGKPSRISKSILKAQIDQITLTILDLNNEVHDVHHPVSSAENYEDQKTEALRRATDFRKNRVPKFFSLFQITLETNSESKQWLIGSSFTTADLALYQVRSI